MINADDAFADYFALLAAPRRVLTFGLLRRADVGASFDPDAVASGRFRLLTPSGGSAVTLPLPGRHNVMNALAASALATALGVPLATIRAGLEAAPAVAGRLVRRPHVGRRDRHRRQLQRESRLDRGGDRDARREPGERALVLGDMAELGATPSACTRTSARWPGAAASQRLYAVGPLSQAAVGAFGNGAMHCADQAQLVAALRPKCAAA